MSINLAQEFKQAHLSQITELRQNKNSHDNTSNINLNKMSLHEEQSNYNNGYNQNQTRGAFPSIINYPIDNSSFNYNNNSETKRSLINQKVPIRTIIYNNEKVIHNSQTKQETQETETNKETGKAGIDSLNPDPKTLLTLKLKKDYFGLNSNLSLEQMLFLIKYAQNKKLLPDTSTINRTDQIINNTNNITNINDTNNVTA